jgi:hypothetical protein
MGFILSRFLRFHIALTAGNGEAKRKWNDWREEEKREGEKRERQRALVFGGQQCNMCGDGFKVAIRKCKRFLELWQDTRKK